VIAVMEMTPRRSGGEVNGSMIFALAEDPAAPANIEDWISILDRMGTFLIETDTKGIIDKCNKAGQGLLGFKEAIGTPLVSWIEPNSVDNIENTLWRSSKDEATLALDFAVTQKDKDVVNAFGEANPRRMRNAQGETNLTGTIYCGRMRPRGEVWISLDLEHNVIGTNTHCNALLFCDDRDATYGTEFMSLVSAGKEEIEYALKEAEEGEWTSGLNVTMQEKGGEKTVDLTLDVQPRLSLQGELEGAAVIGRQLQTGFSILPILDSLGIPGWLTDSDGQIDDCNRCAVGLVEHLKEEQIGTILVEQIVIDSDKTLVGGSVECAVEGEAANDLKVGFLTKSGVEINVVADLCPRKKGDQIIGTIVIAKKREDELSINEDLGVVAWFTDRDGNIDDCTKAAIELIKYTKEEQLGWNLKDKLVLEHDKTAIKVGIESAIHAEHSMSGQTMGLERKDGEGVRTVCEIRPRRKGDEIIGSVVTAVVAPWLESDKVAQVLDQWGICAWLTDTNGEIEECNKTACALLEYERSQQVGLNISTKLMDNQSMDKSKGSVNAAVQGVDTGEHTLGMVSESGRAFQVMASFAPRTHNYQIVGTIVTARALDMMGLLDKLGIIIWFNDLDGNVVDCTSEAVNCLGKSKDEQTGMNFVNAIVEKPDQKSAYEATMMRAPKGKNTNQGILYVVPQEGDPICLTTDTIPRFGSDSKINGSVVIGQYLTRDEIIYNLDKDGTVINCTLNAAKVLGEEKRDDIIGKPFVKDIVTESSQIPAADVIDQAQKGDPTWSAIAQQNPHFDKTVMGLDGKDGLVWLLTDVAPTQKEEEDQAGAVVRGLVCPKDAITGPMVLDMLDKNGIAAWLTDGDGSIEECNRAACDLVGVLKDEQLGLNWKEKIAAEGEQANVEPIFGTTLLGHEPDGLEMKVVRSDGKEVDVKTEMGPRRAGDKVIGSIICARRDPEKQLMEIMDRLGIGTWLNDTGNVIDDLNEVAEDIVKMMKPDQIGLELAESFVTDDERDNQKEAIEKGNEDDETRDLTLDMTPKEGKDVGLLTDTGPRMVKPGSMVLARRDPEKDLMDAMDKVLVGAWLTDNEGIVVSCNRIACDLTDYTRPEQIGKVFKDVLSDEAYSAVVESALKSSTEV